MAEISGGLLDTVLTADGIDARYKAAHRKAKRDLIDPLQQIREQRDEKLRLIDAIARTAEANEPQVDRFLRTKRQRQLDGIEQTRQDDKSTERRRAREAADALVAPKLFSPALPKQFAPFVVVEIGSSGARAEVIQPHTDGSFTSVVKYSQAEDHRKRTGKPLPQLADKGLNLQRMRLSMDWIRRTVLKAEIKHGTRQVFAFGTSPFRLENGAEGKSRFDQSFPVFKLRILSPIEEAEYSFSGAITSYKQHLEGAKTANVRVAVVDVGGRSVEIAIGTTDGDLAARESYPVGHYTFDRDPRLAATEFDAARHFIENSGADLVLITAGSGKTVRVAAAQLNGTEPSPFGLVTQEDLETVGQFIERSSSAEIDSVLVSGKADDKNPNSLRNGTKALQLLLAGSSTHIHVVEGGTRTGVAVEHVAALTKKTVDRHTTHTHADRRPNVVRH